MLNACRRHGSVHTEDNDAMSSPDMCSTPVGVMDRFTQGHVFRNCDGGGAQRLSASWIGSRGDPGGGPGGGVVLNACRRHGSVHHGGASRALRFWRVLNACRRHGSVHKLIRMGTGVLFRCSTPVGVMDRFTPGQPDSRRHVVVVLNACRRHGSVHQAHDVEAKPFQTVLNACRRHGSVHASLAAAASACAASAQRLSASWIGSPCNR